MMLHVEGRMLPVWSIHAEENLDGDYYVSVTIDGGGSPNIPIVEGIAPRGADLLSVETWLTWRGYSKPLHG